MLELVYVSDTAVYADNLIPRGFPGSHYNVYLQTPPRIYYEDVRSFIGCWSVPEKPGLGAPNSYILYAIMNTYWWPSWSLRVWEFDAGNGELIRTQDLSLDSNYPGLTFITAFVISPAPRASSLYMLTNVPHKIHEIDSDTLTLTGNAWDLGFFVAPTGPVFIIEAFCFDPDLDRAILHCGAPGSFFRNDEVGIFKLSTGEYVSKVRVAGIPRYIVAESDGHCYAVNRIGNVTLIDYLETRAVGTFRLTISKHLTLIPDWLVSYDPVFKRVLYIEKTPPLEDGASTIVIKGYRSVNLPVDITPPVQNSILRPGKTGKVTVRAYGDSGEGIVGVNISLSSAGGSQVLRSPLYTDVWGYASFDVKGITAGTDAFTATATLPDPDVKQGKAGTTGARLVDRISTYIPRIDPSKQMVQRFSSYDLDAYLLDRPYGPLAAWNVPALKIPTHPNSAQLVSTLLEGSVNGPFQINIYKSNFEMRYSRDATEYVNITSTLGNGFGRRMPWNPAWFSAVGAPHVPTRLVIFDTEQGVEWNIDSGVIENSNLRSGYCWAIKNDYRYGDTTSKGNSFYDGLPWSVGVTTALEMKAAMLRRDLGEQHIARSSVPHALAFYTYNLKRPQVLPALRAPLWDSVNGIPVGTRFALDMDEEKLDSWIDQFVAMYDKELNFPFPVGGPFYKAAEHFDEVKKVLKIIGYTLRDYGIIVRGIGGDAINLEAQRSGDEVYTEIGFQDRTLIWDRDLPLSDKHKIGPTKLLEGLFTKENMRALAPADSYAYPSTNPNTDPIPEVITTAAQPSAEYNAIIAAINASDPEDETQFDAILADIQDLPLKTERDQATWTLYQHYGKV